MRQLDPLLAISVPARRGAWIGGLLLALCFIVDDVQAQNPKRQSRSIQQNLSPEAQQRRLQQFLHRLNLVDLATRDLEDRFATEFDPENKMRIGSQLASQYTRQIRNLVDLADPVRTAEKDDEKKQVRDKLETLQRQYSDLRHPRYSTALLSVDFSQHQNEFFTWATEKLDGTAQKSLVNNLESDQQMWDDVYLNVTEMIDRQNRQIDTNLETPELRERLDELIALQSQLEFIGGWIHYYLAICRRTGRGDSLNKSQKLFMDLLQIGNEENLRSLTADQLELEIDWFARGLIALACIAGARRESATRSELFELLGDPGVSAAIRAELDWWEFHSVAFVSDWDAALDLAEAKLQSMELQANGNDARYWLTVANTAAQNLTDENAKSLLWLAWQGMARENQFAAIAEIAKKYSIDIQPDRFVTRWILGQSSYERAETKNDEEQFKAAQQLIRAALATRENTVGRVDIAQCRYLLGWIEFRLGSFHSAEKLFRQASLGLRSFDPEAAAKSLWLRIVALKNIQTSENKDDRKFLTALNELARLFPGTSYADKASFEITRLRFAESDPREAIDRLKQVRPSNSNYRPARFEIVRLYYRLVTSGKLADAQLETETEMMAFVDSFCKDPENQINYRASAMILVVDYLLSAYPNDQQRATVWNQRSTELLKQLDSSSAEYADIRFQSFRLAKLAGDEQRVAREAGWLASDRNAQANYRSAALIYLAKAIDQRLELAKPEERRRLLIRAESIYADLCKFLDVGRDNLKNSANARIAFSRLADIESELSQLDSAISRYELLHQALPNHQNYIQRLAQLKSQAGKDEEAIQLWRQLAQGSKPGTDAWYEAKYYVATHLAETDVPAALAVIRQTIQLSPQLKDPWKTRFETLQTKLEKK